MKLIFTLKEMNIALGCGTSCSRNNSAIAHLNALGVMPVSYYGAGGVRKTTSYSVAAAANALGTTVEELNRMLEVNRQKLSSKQ